MALICSACRIDVSEIGEYQLNAKTEYEYNSDTAWTEIAPDMRVSLIQQWACENEGTYDSTNSTVLCTICYIEAGMPLNDSL